MKRTYIVLQGVYTGIRVIALQEAGVKSVAAVVLSELSHQLFERVRVPSLHLQLLRQLRGATALLLADGQPFVTVLFEFLHLRA